MSDVPPPRTSPGDEEAVAKAPVHPVKDVDADLDTLLRPRIVIERGRIVPFEELPARSIALDGYCQGPAVDVENEKFSFDHHDKCVRLATRASCQQALDYLLLGLDPKGLTICLNDVDGDTALAVWLLQHPERVREERVRKLVETIGSIDAHGPAYPAMDPSLIDTFFESAMKPEADARRAKTYAQEDLGKLLESCLTRITAFVDGTLEEVTPPEREMEVTFQDKEFAMARSKHFVLDMLYEEGHTRAIQYFELPDGSFSYTIAKKSELVRDFPVGPHSKEGTILYALAQAEPKIEGDDSSWGGGSTIGGAPRHKDGSRSHLLPDQVTAIVRETVQAWKAKKASERKGSTSTTVEGPQA